MTVLRHQRGREGGREYGGGCSAKRTFQTTGRGFSVFLINEVMKKSHARLVYVTDKDSVLCPNQEAVTDYIIIIISPCNHGRADMSVIILVFVSARKGSQKLLIRTVDTYILVLEIAYAERLRVQKLWTAFGTKKKFSSAHAISQALGSAKSRALPMFRSFTRCDMVSELAGNGKKCMVGLGSVSDYNRVIQALLTIGAENDGCHAQIFCAII